MMVKCTPPTIIFLLCFLCNQSLCVTNSNVAACSAKDLQLLMHFKKSIVDPSDLLSCWSTQEDCCRWIGVQCHNTTGRVKKLNLTPSSIDPDYTAELLTGEINLCVLELEFLNYLDLSENNFTTIHYSDNDGQRNQNFSQVTTPHSSVLRHLNFSYNPYLQIDSLRWLTLVPSLKHLDLSGNNLSIVTSWLESITTMLPSVTELRLSFCELRHQHQIPSIQYANFTSLTVLDLSNNDLQMDNLRWLSHFPSLTYLDLSGSNLSTAIDWLHTLTIKTPSVVYLGLASCSLNHINSSLLNLPNLKSLYFYGNELTGTIPEWLGQFEHLQELDLSSNSFQGPIPPILGNISSLILLDVSHNQLNGSLPERLGQLLNLETLSVRGNSMARVLSEIYFSKLSNLKVLDLSSSAFSFNWDPSGFLHFKSNNFI
ncbi:hypothetical protein L6164_001368 [Bauhinia variegata]|uniref:Uncharacterized protein n=1 Tax=Bauhinia variegata TaxID=167791 RepID=A0ACB9Q9X0_BAUVA|nr:hypothetical protein L6164_001368 [Bauhinia variegata]